ncbi:type I restriction-modification enzyme, R subunit [Lentisphaera araneosa HTCC2155]|uniref:Type I restriction enzyme endonuclease subunit n=1 Tax=Lentisphaera araneosa HTCC2155 TaxID=313628 RepID=A6DSC1_9BACT|nr:HsdR family type I site-specific deoxyribonuclease [Lentisphaera araneosa]EDM25466.1 type I restriction-modification enzyme, R subunit [Lentisphaera araneosa HTCC2155]
MSTLPQTKEELSSQIPALKLLMNLGYEYLNPEEALKHRGGNTANVILRDVLIKYLQQQTFVWKGQEHPLSNNAIDTIIRELTPSMNEGLMVVNEKIYNKLTLGITVTEFIDGKKASPTIPIINWKEFHKNSFHVTDEMEVLAEDGLHNRRPDIICFVNGLPLAVIEAKRPDGSKTHEAMLAEGISQNIRNQGIKEIPQLFAYSQLLMSINGLDGRYATTGTPAKFWAKWREENIIEEDFISLKNTALSSAKKSQLFEHRPAWIQKYFAEREAQGELLPTDQDRLIISLLEPKRFLEFIQFFILFDQKTGKIAARYQQFFGIRSLIERINTRKPQGGREGGVIWHTTGSGKSFTMVFLSKALLLHESLAECRIIVVTDRVDLETQLNNTFKSGGAISGKKDKAKSKVSSGRDLAQRIGRGTERIIFSIINKFNTASKQEECYNDSENIVVLIDEGHRSHNGENHERMRQALPNAAYVAFTGTPLLKDDKTTNKFGKIIHAYTMQRSVEDGTTTPLLYEERIPELEVNENAIDKWFERITEGLTEEQKVDLKKKYAKKGQIYKTDGRIELIAHDISDHFVKNIDRGLKGQLATDSKLDAIRYKKYLDEIGIVSSAVVISAPDTREGHTEVDEAKLPEVQEWWKKNVGKEDEQTYTKAVIEDFAREDGVDLLIVVDKLLTGFDEPKNAVLYMDKPLKAHNLIQAIARVNRLHSKKKFGLLIDYRGILKELDTTIQAYQDLAERTQHGYDIEDLAGLYSEMSVEYKKLPQLHADLWDLFKDIKNKADIEQYRQLLIPSLVTDDEGHSYDQRLKVREDFYEALNEFSSCLKVALASVNYYDDKSFTEEQRSEYKRDLKWFNNLRKIIRNDANETVDYSLYEERIGKLLNKHVAGTEVREPEGVYVVSELGKPEDWTEEKTRNETDIIKSRVKKIIDEELKDDPYAQKVFSELLNQAIAEAKAMFNHPYKGYALFKNFEDKLNDRQIDDLPEVFADNLNARAFYGVFKIVLNEDFSNIPENEAIKLSFLIDETVNKAVAENSISPQNIENQIRKDLLPQIFKMGIGMDRVKEVLEQVIQITRFGAGKDA